NRELGGEFFDGGLALVAQVDRRAGTVDFEAADLTVEISNRLQKDVRVGDVVFDLGVEIILHLRETRIGEPDTIGEDAGILQQTLALADVGRVGSEALEGVEKIVERGGDAGVARAAGGAERAGRAGYVLAE